MFKLLMLNFSAVKLQLLHLYFCLNCLQQYHKECQLQTCYLVIVLTQLLLEQQYASIAWKALKVPNWKSVSEGPVGEEGRAVHY